MLEDYQRAAMLTNPQNVTWHQFVISRFVVRLGYKANSPCFAVDIQAVDLQSRSHAEIRGFLEYSTDSSLPVVYEFLGSLDLETREVLINSGPEENPEKCYAGRFSENGRVLELRSRIPAAPQSKQLHLIHEATIAELFGSA